MGKVGLSDLNTLGQNAHEDFETIVAKSKKVMDNTNFEFVSNSEHVKFMDELIYLEGDLSNFLLGCTEASFGLGNLFRTIEGPNLALDNVKKSIFALKSDFDMLSNNTRTAMMAVRNRREYISRYGKILDKAQNIEI